MMVRFLSTSVMMMTMMMLPLFIVVVRGSSDKGEDVCSAVSGAKDCSRCLDTSAVVAHEGSIYCARDPDATVSTNGLGITYSQRSDDGTSEADTKWWKNIEPCAPNTKGHCHYEDDIEGIFSKADEEEPVTTVAVNATEAPAISAAEPLMKKSTTALISLVTTAISGVAVLLLA